MKVFKRMHHGININIDRAGSNSGGTATTTVSSLSVAGENDTILSERSNNYHHHDEDNIMTQQQQANTTPRTTKLVQKLKLTRKQSKEEAIAEARNRAAKRLEPPPFTSSKLSRLEELKEAKARAEMRLEERSSRCGSSSSIMSVVSSSSTTNNNMSVKSLGTLCSTVELLEECDQMVKRDALIFVSSLVLHLALLPLRHYTLLAIVLVALQAISLRFIFSSVLVYAFDNIDFGQKELVKNMDYGKKLFVEEIRKYSTLVSVAVAAVSCVIALGKSIVHLLFTTGNFLCSLSESYKFMCDKGAEATEVQSWGLWALDISSFLTSRLGVFVLAFLFLGHVLLPKPQNRSDKASVADDSDREIRSTASDADVYNRRRSQIKGHHGALSTSVSFLLATVAISSSSTVAATPSSTMPSQNAIKSILVAGSLNADTFLPIHRFPSPGENLTLLPGQQPMVDVPGGKGCNQAIACAKLTNRLTVSFLGQFGNDGASKILQNALVDNDVDISSCGYSKRYPSGRGYVMIVPDTGEVSAVVSGGSNLYGWSRWGAELNDDSANAHENDVEPVLTDQDIQEMVSSHSLLLLQCEIPHLVNLRLARAAQSLNIPVIVDVGGEDRKMERELLERCDYLVPNETELERLARSYQEEVNDSGVMQRYGMTRQQMVDIQAQIGSSLCLASMLNRVETLQKNGAGNVLVTLGSCGSLLIKSSSAQPSSVLYQPSCPLPVGASVVDETGAGDCYRAGFAVALLEHCKGSANDADDETLLQCMKFAAAAGALAVTKNGAVPSIPSRKEVEDLLSVTSDESFTKDDAPATVEAVPRGGSSNDEDKDNFPFLFGSRINSMKDRQDLVDPSSLPLSTPRDYLRRQATIRGLGCVDFNYPQHFGEYWTPQEAKEALDEVGLVAGAVCLRYPSKFARGAMNHPDEDMRREAIEITKQAAEAARELGCNEVVVWSAYDGYDYPFQVNYQEKWSQIVSAFRELCDAYPDIKWSLEYKPTDENTRFFTVPSTGAAILLVKEIDRPNMGLTLDVGHMLMSGENPGQSIAMAGEKLFGIQLNDGYTRLAAEDGMMFGSVHPSMALEVMHQLQHLLNSPNNFGHFYFDTFPQRTDPVKEAEYNIRKVKEFWRAAERMDGIEVERITREHDAIGALELVNEALRR